MYRIIHAVNDLRVQTSLESIPWQDAELYIDPQVPIDDATRALPARWAVYLMLDAERNPVQLLCVKNLRASVRRRLGESAPDAGPSRRIDYRGLVRYVRWRRVDSRLMNDLTYLDVARVVYPTRWQTIVNTRPAWWLHIDAEAQFPRWKITDDPTLPTGQLFGPIAEKGLAQKVVERIEDLFDLCRYHNVLQQSPRGAPCAYKDMGRCPAPCDGSVSMQQYRQLIDWSIATIADPTIEIDDHSERMRQAAGELRFETASKIKQFIDGLKSLRTADARFIAPLDCFGGYALAAGPVKNAARLLHIDLAGVHEMLGVLQNPTDLNLSNIALPPKSPIDALRLAIIAHHQMRPGDDVTFIERDQLSPRTLSTAYKHLTQKQTSTPSTIANDDEGVLREAVVSE